MDFLELIAVGFSTGFAVLSAAGLVLSAVKLRRSGDDRITRVVYGWSGGLSLLLFPTSCAAFSAGLAGRVATSPFALLGVMLANVLAQPFFLLMLLAGARKLYLGLMGRVGYAWRELTDADLAGCSQKDRRQMSRFCIFQGLIVVSLAGALSMACLWPLLQ